MSDGDDPVSPELRDKLRIDHCFWIPKRRLKRCAVYVIAPEADRRPSKVGVSHNPLVRLGKLQVSHWKRMRVYHALHVEAGERAYEIEGAAHKLLESTGLLGEWFDVPSRIAFEAVQQAANTLGVDFKITDPLRLDKAQKVV